MIINLIKPITENEAKLLSSINITVSDEYLEVPDTRDTYCKVNGYNYAIHCHNDETPVASIFIKNEAWDQAQIINISEKQIAIAKEKLASNTAIEPTEYPDYEERCRRVKNGDNSCLFETPFSKLRFDEQDIVRKSSYRREGSEQFYPLSEHGLKVVEKIRDIKRQLDFIKSESLSFSFFAEKRDREIYWKSYATEWNNLVDGKHELTQGMRENQIRGYFGIANNQEVSRDFQEPTNAASHQSVFTLNS